VRVSDGLDIFNRTSFIEVPMMFVDTVVTEMFVTLLLSAKQDWRSPIRGLRLKKQMQPLTGLLRALFPAFGSRLRNSHSYHLLSLLIAQVRRCLASFRVRFTYLLRLRWKMLQ